MQPDGSTLGSVVNTPLTRSFRAIVTAGWANKSDGDVESPVGHFALVTIDPPELKELLDAVFDGDLEGDPLPYPGAYIVREDSDGNCEVTEYLVESQASAVYDTLVQEYAKWGVGDEPEEDEKLYLVHDSCGEAFDDIAIAQAHTCEPRYDSGNMLPGYEWAIKSESEAM